MRAVAIIQARMTSSRLPGKVLLKLRNNEKVLDSVYRRIKSSTMIDDAVIATSTDMSDDMIEQHCISKGYSCYRGSLEDVLDRFYTCALQYKAEIVIRVTADCPLVDYYLNDDLMKHFLENKPDYAGVAHGQHALGIATEICSIEALCKAYRLAKFPHREHVTTFMYKNPELFKCLRIEPTEVYKESRKYRLTLDTVEDYDLVKAIFKGIPSDYITIDEVNEFLKHNRAIADLNTNVLQKGV